MTRNIASRSLIALVPAAMVALAGCASADRTAGQPTYEEGVTIKPVEDLQPPGDMQPGTTPGVSRSPSGFDASSEEERENPRRGDAAPGDPLEGPLPGPAVSEDDPEADQQPR